MWSEDDKARIRSTLARYVGPVASFIVEAATRRAKTRRALADTLAQEITLPRDRKSFLREMARLFPRVTADQDDEGGA